MTTPLSPIELDAMSLISHSARTGIPFEEYLKSVARSARVKIKKIGTGLKDFEDKEDIG